MKKLFIALALIGMVGSVSAITVSAATGVEKVHVKGDKDKKKKKKKKECCSADSAKAGCSKEGGEKKKCCSGGK
jgi:hypothetical protein